MSKRLLVVALTLAVAVTALLGAQQPPPMTAIRAARLFDGKSEASVTDAVVLVQGGRITAAGARLAIPAGTQVVDLGDATILPGFIDAHTHVTDQSSDDCNGDLAAALRRTVMAGFTTMEKGTYLVPTLMDGEYAGGRKATRKYPPEIAAKALQALDGRSSAFKRAVAAGVKIAFGTDSGVSPHGRNAKEFALLVEHGLSAAAALRTSATAAVLLGIDRTTGTIEAGKEADIVGVPGDVLQDIAATERVRFVMKAGKVIRNDR